MLNIKYKGAIKIENEDVGEHKNLPEKKFSTGTISATVWKNYGKSKKTGKEVEFRTIQVTKRYQDKEGNWNTTNSLRPDDLPKVILVTQKAYEYCLLKKVV